MDLSIKEAAKTIVKSSQSNFLFITFIFILPLTLFQMLFVYNLFETVKLVSNQSIESMFSYFIYNIVYMVLFLTFYLLSTSSIIYTMASLYVSKPVSCYSTIFAVPRLSKRILITFLYALPLLICASLATLAYIYLMFVRAKMKTANVIAVIFDTIYALFVAYFDLYVIVLLNFANVISVLEPNIHAFSTMKRSKQLLRGFSPYARYFVAHYFLAGSVILFIGTSAVFMDHENYIIARILLAFCVIIMAGVNFVGLIGQSVLYYSCKNYHNQVINKEILHAHLAGEEINRKA